MKHKILVVDDNPDIVTFLKDRLEALGYEAAGVYDGTEAIDWLQHEQPDVMLLDLFLPRMSGMDVLKTLGQPRDSQGRFRELPTHLDHKGLPVIVITAQGTIEKAVDAMKAGAYDFLTKPLDVDHLAIVIKKALEHESLKQQVEYFRTELESRYAQIVGTSQNIDSVLNLAKRAANSNANVLLLGESGTGKELFARSIHHWSPRRERPFVVINCVAIPETLLENELFGHEKEAFTEARSQKKGRLEAADGGTVFLDEIGDMPQSLQAKLLRVLEDQQFERLGGRHQVRVNLRFIAATNKDLGEAIKTGAFRDDLYYRLNVISLAIPPLRHRKEDIPPLANYFLARHAYEVKRPHMTLSSEAIEAMTRYDWPGNIRALENAIARAVVLSPTDEITSQDLGLVGTSSQPILAQHDSIDMDDGLPYHESMRHHKRRIISRALKKANGSQTRAAELLGLQRTYLARLIHQLDIDIGTFQD